MSDLKENHFLELLDNNFHPIQPTYTRNGAWLKTIGFSNSLHVRVTRAITNHISQIRYSLVVILELNGVSEVQYKDVMMIDDGKYQ